MTKPVRAVGYCRISRADKLRTDDQQRASLRAQRESITRYCELMGWELVDVVEDFAKTGANEDRDGWQSVLSRLGDKHADRLVVTRLDRITREADVGLGLIKRGRYKWTIAATEQAIDTTTASGWMAASMFFVVAEFERLQLGERTSAVLAQRKREGVVPGRKSNLARDVEDLIVAKASEGLSLSAIARELDAQGKAAPNGGTRWHHSQVKAALQRAELRRIREANQHGD